MEDETIEQTPLLAVGWSAYLIEQIVQTAVKDYTTWLGRSRGPSVYIGRRAFPIRYGIGTRADARREGAARRTRALLRQAGAAAAGGSAAVPPMWLRDP